MLRSFSRQMQARRGFAVPQPVEGYPEGVFPLAAKAALTAQTPQSGGCHQPDIECNEFNIHGIQVC